MHPPLTAEVRSHRSSWSVAFVLIVWFLRKVVLSPKDKCIQEHKIEPFVPTYVHLSMISSVHSFPFRQSSTLDRWNSIQLAPSYARPQAPTKVPSEGTTSIDCNQSRSTNINTHCSDLQNSIQSLGQFSLHAFNQAAI